ncbi:hypothetical protein [Ancylobacter sp. G4_0304]|uniref:hypothetical protein n=1 Tax=Ancylobacter sp. G4_0304 TaxID=3114289 RepID=UPI0039C6D63C
MWDFSFRTSLGLVARTFPFVLLRLAVYLGIAFFYVLATGLGIGAGWGIGSAFDDGALTGAALGGFVGFFTVAGVLWWVRAYILYLVKAGHVAALDARLRGLELPAGQGQIGYATGMVKARFVEVNLLFGLDVLLRGAIAALVGLAGMLLFWVPDGGQLARFFHAVLRISLGLVDEVILAYIIRHGEAAPGESARDGLVLYAQNAGMLLKNGIWIALMEYALAILIFLLLLSPAIGLAYAMPGGLTGFGVAFAAVLAWSLKRALIEPVSIACLLQAYDRAIAGQVPDPQWTARLDGASAAFREMAGRGDARRGAPWQSGAATG